MKQTFFVATVMVVLIPTHALAQRGGAGAGIGRAMGPSGSVGRPSARHVNGSDSHLNRFANDFGRTGLGRSSERRGGGECNGCGGPYPDYGDYGYLPGDGQAEYQPQGNPSLVIPAQEVQPEPSLPVQPEIHEYQWPGVSGETGSLFSIISKDGTVYRARAVWLQDSIVHFTNADGGGGQLPLDGVERESTRRANAELNLKLPLPGW